jgi:ABC-2 type transport system permease protein
MRATSVIYRRELGAYLRSPFTWVIAALVLLIDGIFFIGFAMRGDQLSAQVLERFFYFSSGVTSIGAGLLLSFRLINEERTNHSMVLLNTSPVRDSHIVVGKFLAALTFLIFLLAISVYMPLLIKVRGKVSFTQIMAGYVGLTLLGAATLAIGTFASSLAKNQLVAGFIGLVMIILLVFLFQFARALEGNVRDVLQELDLWWIHFQNGFMRGVVNLKDVVYYLAVTYFFLLVSVKTLEAKRWQ